ncbi:MAG: class II aldolase/adducin family protein [Candidatus Asgardarchaeia archaeon]
MYRDLKEKIVETFKFIVEIGLSYGKSGNISVRAPDKGLFLITPSGVKKGEMSWEDVLVIDEEGKVVEGKEGRRPSIETPTHLAIYKARKDVNAIIHTHGIYTSAFASSHKDIPPILEEIIINIGGGIKVAKYAMAGTDELAKNVLEGLGDRKAVIMANHGVLACGKDLDDALEVIELAERYAKIYLLSMIVGTPKELPKETIELERKIYLSNLF